MSSAIKFSILILVTGYIQLIINDVNASDFMISTNNYPPLNKWYLDYHPYGDVGGGGESIGRRFTTEYESNDNDIHYDNVGGGNSGGRNKRGDEPFSTDGGKSVSNIRKPLLFKRATTNVRKPLLFKRYIDDNNNSNKINQLTDRIDNDDGQGDDEQQFLQHLFSSNRRFTY